jgi:hypothetical protein
MNRLAAALLVIFLSGIPAGSAVFNSPDRVVYANQAAGTLGPFNLRGGTYWIETKSTGTGSIDLKKLGPDGTTYTARITQITATAGQQTISLPPGSYEWVVATFTANYLEITRIPTAVE